MEITKEVVRKRLITMIVFIIVSVMLLITTVMLNFEVSDQKINPGEVEKTYLTITRIKEQRHKINTMYTYYTEYQGKECKINGLQGSYPKEGDSIEVYIYKDELYANMNSIRTNSSIANIYFTFLGITYFMIIITSIVAGYYIQDKKKLKSLQISE